MTPEQIESAVESWANRSGLYELANDKYRVVLKLVFEQGLITGMRQQIESDLKHIDSFGALVAAPGCPPVQGQPDLNAIDRETA